MEHTVEVLKLGFKSDEIPVSLTNNTSPNDFCTSYYFKKGGEYFLLWVEHQDPKYREDPDSPRYAISYAINEGDEAYPEIYSDPSRNDLFRSENVDELKAYLLDANT